MRTEIRSGLKALGITSQELKRLRRKDKKRAGLIEKVSKKFGETSIVIFSLPANLSAAEQKAIFDAQWNSNRHTNRAKNLSQVNGFVNTHDGRRFIRGKAH